MSEFWFLLKVYIVRNSFTKFSNILLVSSLSIYSNAADYKPQRLDEKTIYSNSEHSLNDLYPVIKKLCGCCCTSCLVAESTTWSSAKLWSWFGLFGRSFADENGFTASANRFWWMCLDRLDFFRSVVTCLVFGIF